MMKNVNVIWEILSNGYNAESLIIITMTALIAGLFIIISKNPIISVMCLIGLFVSVSLYLMELGLVFIGLAYLLVYVGAVSILFIFILMLINVRVSELLTQGRNSLPLAVLTVLLFSSTVNLVIPNNIVEHDISSNYLFSMINNTFYNMLYQVNLSPYNYLSNGSIASVYGESWDSALVESSHITSIGNILYTNVFMLLIVTSLILLLAMVGAIVITIKLQSNIKTNVIKDNININ